MCALLLLVLPPSAKTQFCAPLRPKGHMCLSAVYYLRFSALCACHVSVQAPSAKTRFAPPSALKGTCDKPKMEAGWLVAWLPRPRVVVCTYYRVQGDCSPFGSQSPWTRPCRAHSPLASVASSLRSSAPPCFHLRLSSVFRVVCVSCFGASTERENPFRAPLRPKGHMCLSAECSRNFNVRNQQRT